MRNLNERGWRLAATTIILTSTLLSAGVVPVLAATTVNANAAADVNADVTAGNVNANAGFDTGKIINDVGANLNTPAVHEAVTQTVNVAQSPELHSAVGSFWLTIWNMGWPFLSGTVQKFFGLFVTAWQTLEKMPQEARNGNVNMNANAPLNTNVQSTP